MKKIGKVVGCFKDKLLVVKLELTGRIPEIGDIVCLPDMTPIGKITDIIGRVDDPYALVSPLKKHNIERFIGKSLYVKRPPSRPSRKRRARES